VARTLPSSGATALNIQEALAEVFRLGWFSDVALELYPGNGGYRAALAVVENPIVEAVEIEGNSLVPSGEIMDELEGQLGAVLNNGKVTAALDRVVARYRAKGFLLVRVERAGLSADGRTLEVVMNEGRVDGIGLAGQKHTRPSLLRRKIETRPGQPLNFTTLERDIQHLYGLNHFESLNVDMADSGADGVNLTFRVREKPRTTVRLGLRYDLEDAFTGLADVSEDNITGRGIRTSLTVLFGNYTDLTLRYYSPVLFVSPCPPSRLLPRARLLPVRRPEKGGRAEHLAAGRRCLLRLSMVQIRRQLYPVPDRVSGHGHCHRDRRAGKGHADRELGLRHLRRYARQRHIPLKGSLRQGHV
jgi:outer membrane protein assembly factor BamA